MHETRAGGRGIDFEQRIAERRSDGEDFTFHLTW